MTSRTSSSCALHKCARIASLEIPKMPSVLLKASIVISLTLKSKRRLIFSRTLFLLHHKDTQRFSRKKYITCERRKTRSEFFVCQQNPTEPLPHLYLYELFNGEAKRSENSFIAPFLRLQLIKSAIKWGK
jgi:hypothetical protein